MTRKRSSPMGLELYLPVLLAFIMLPLLAQAAPLQDYTEIQQYTEGCYYNYNHYNEGDRIMTNEPCLNCTCHNKMLMCYLRVCPFTKPIGHDCIVEKREDQCCPIITCPEVPVDVASHTVPEPGTELSFPEKFGCSIDSKFYLEGAQVPSNPNKPCELCYCIKNRTSCLMQECTLHIDGCTPIYNKGSCCPVRYNCDHENDVLELEDHSSSTTEAATTTTTQRPTTGFIISSTASPAITTDCIHNSEVYADGAKILGETACENCYCMRGDIVCAVQECGMPMLSDNGKLCHPLPAAEGECCPNNYVCQDDTATTEIYEATTLPYAYGLDEEVKLTTTGPVKDLHGAIPEEDLQLQTHIDDELAATKTPSTESEKAAATTAVTGQPFITSSQDKEQHTEPESITKQNESADEITTVSSEAEELTTTNYFSSEHQTESSATDTIKDAKVETSSTEVTEKTVTEYPLQANKESTLNISTSTDELTKTSTTTIDSEEKYLTTTLTSDKSEIGEAVTETPEDVITEKQSTTEFATTENLSGVTAEAVDEEYVTQIPIDNERLDISETNKEESEKSETASHTTKSEQPITVAYNISEQEPTLIDSTTVLADIPDVENVTDKELQSTEQQQELNTELPVKSPEEEEILGEKTYEQSTKASISNEKQESSTTKAEQEEEEESEATTQAGIKDITEKEESATVKPKIEIQSEEDEQQAATIFPMTSEEIEKSTESVESLDEEPSVHTTFSPIQISEIARVTKKPDLAAEEHAHINEKEEENKQEEEEEKEKDTESVTDKLTTKSPIYIDSVTISDEIEGSSEGSGHYDIHKLETTSSTPIKAEDHITETKPIFDEELGSGDFTTDGSAEHQFEISTTSAAVTSISQEQEKEKDYVTTVKPVTATEDKDTSLEESDESEEDDDKLIYLTTAKPIELERTTLAAEKSKQEEEMLEMTTVTTLLDDVSASTVATTKKVSEEEMATITDEKLPVSTTARIKTEAETISADVIEATTMATSSQKHLSTVGPKAGDENENKLLEEVEVSSKPAINDEAEEHKLDNEGNKEPEIYEESTEAEDITTSKSVERHEQHQETPSTQSTIDMATEAGKLDDNIRPESEEHKLEVQPDSQTPITDFISSFTTTKPTSQTDIRTETDVEQELESSTIAIAVKGDFEKESTGSTFRPFDEPNRIDEIPDLQIPAIIPGEGDCLVRQQTFKNNSLVPTSNECELTCKCVSSIVICDHVKCSVPENADKCILDNHSTNKCCPSYICDTDTVSAESGEGANSIEEDEDEDEEDTQTTVSHKISTDLTTEKANISISEVTTIKPSSTSAAASVSIPEIEIPVAMTEEPMSHIKDEEEFEPQTTKSPIKTMPDEKHDIFVEEDISTTNPPIVEDNIIPQAVPPSEISQQGEISGEKLPAETTKEPAHSASHDQTEESLEENTTFKQGISESATDSILHTSSTESEMHSTTDVPVNEYQTSKAIEEKEDEKESTEFQTPSVLHTDKSSEASATITEAQTDISVLHETTEEPKLILPIESHQEKESVPELEQEHTTHAAETVEFSTSAVPLAEMDSETSTRFAETQKEIEDIPHSTDSAKIAEHQPTEDNKKEIFDATTIIPASKDNDTENNEVHIVSTTTNYLEEHISFTTKQPPAINKDYEIALEISPKNTSSVASATEDYKDIVEPTTAGLAEKEIELSTTVLGISDDASNERVTSATADFNLESTVSPLHEEESHTKSTTPESFSSQSSEPETPTKITPVFAHTEKDKDEETQTSVSVSDDETATAYTPSADIGTEKPIYFETKIISSSTPTADKLPTEVSPHDIKEEKSTTMAAEIDKLYGSEESTEDYNIQSSTYGSIAQQTEPAKEFESEETTENAAATLEKVTHSTKGKIPTIEQTKDEFESSMAHTIDSLAENEEATTKSPSALDQYKPEGGTTRATIVEETTTSTILEVNKDYKSSTTVPSIEIPSTHTPAKLSPLDSSEESSGESTESAEEISNKLDEKTTHKPVIAPTSSEEEDEEKEVSGEEGEEVGDEVEKATAKPQKATTELFTSTEHEVSSDKTPQEDIVSLVTTAPTSDTTNMEISLGADKTDRYDILNSTQATFTEQEAEHVTEQQTEENKIPAVTENAQQQETEEVTDKLKDKPQITSETSEIENVTDEHLSDEKMLDVTKVPASVNEIETITISYPKGEGVEDITKAEESEHVTKNPEEEEKDGKEEEPSTTEALFSADEIKQATTSKYPIDSKDIYEVTTEQSIGEDEGSSAFTSSPAAVDKNGVTTDISYKKESEEQEIIEFTTAKLPADERSEVIAPHIPADDIDQQTEKLADAEIDDFVTTDKPAKVAEHVTATPASEKDLSVTKVPPILAEDDATTKIGKESEAQTTAVPMISQDEISTDFTTELPIKGNQSEEIYHEHITEIPEVTGLSYATEQSTEFPSKTSESEKEESPEDTTRVTEVTAKGILEEVTQLPTAEESHEEADESPTNTEIKHLPHTTESVTELFTKDIEPGKENVHEKITELPIDLQVSFKNTTAEKETDLSATELPVDEEVSTHKLSEQDIKLTTKDSNIEDETSSTEANELPAHIDESTNAVYQSTTKLPTKVITPEEESHEQTTKSALEAEITTEKVFERITELPTQSQEIDNELHTLMPEHSTQLPVDVSASSEKISEYTTELPIENIKTNVEVEGTLPKLPEHDTLSPSKEEDVSLEESSELPVSNEAIDKLAESPTKTKESAEENIEEVTELPVPIYTSGPIINQTIETSTESKETISGVKLQPTTMVHPLFAHHTTFPSIDSRLDDTTWSSMPIAPKEEEKYTTPTTTTISSTSAEPFTTSAPHYQPQPPIYGQSPQYGPTQYEDEYTDEDDGEIFGPGTCRYGGKLYVSAQQIPRDDPCDFCFCFRSDIICLQQSCPPPISGCHEEPISGFCCPRYECPVSMATVLNITTSTTTTSTTLPPHFLHHSYGNRAQRNGCLINGRSYRVGEKIESTSGPCINCACGGDGKMKCDPQACVPEPTMQQVMAVVAAGRKR